MRRSLLMNVPSFSPQPAAGKTEIRAAAGVRGGEHVLHDEEIEVRLLSELAQSVHRDGIFAVLRAP